MQVSDISEIGISDFHFFMTVAKHPKLNVKNAIQVLDLLGKCYLGSPGFGRAAGVPFVIVCTRFVETAPLQEYLYRFCKYALKLVVDFEKQRKAQSQKKVPKYLTNALAIAGLNEELPEEAISGQRRIMTYDMVSRVINMKNMSLNIRLKELLISFLFSLKKDLGKYSKGMMVVLGLLGNPEEIMQKAEEEEQRIALANSSDQSETPSGRGKVESMLKSYIGFPSVKQLHKASSRMPKRRVLKAIERAKKRREDKEAEQIMKEDQQKRIHERQKRALRRQFEQMKLNSEKTPLIVAESSEIQVNEGFYVDLKLETAENQDGVNLILRKYVRVLKLLFDKYASSGYRKGTMPHEVLGEHTNTISEAEMFKLLKEQGVYKELMSKDEHMNVFRTYCAKTNRADNMQVDYEGYKGLMIQEALFIFSEPPKDLSVYPPFVAVNALFDLFRNHKSEKSLPIRYYDEPDPGAGDREIVNKLNEQLAKDPTMALPEGYRKTNDKELVVEWTLPDTVLIPESTKMALYMVDEVVAGVCDQHVIEPQYRFVQVVRARGVLAAPVTAQSQGISASNTQFVGAAPLPTATLRTHIDPVIKYYTTLLISNYSKDHVAECAKLLDDLFYSVEMKSPILLSKDKRNAAQLTNKVKLKRDMEEKEMKLEQEKAEQRRKLRLQVVKETLKQMQDEKQSVSKAEQERTKLSQQEKLARLQKRTEDRNKQREEQIKKLQEWKNQKQPQETNEVERKNKEEMERKRKTQEEFLAREKRRIRELLKEKEIQREEMNKKNAEEEKRKAEMRKNSRQRLIHKFEIQHKRHEEERAKKDQLYRLSSSPEFSSILQEYDRSIEAVFKHFAGQTTKPDQNPVLASTALQYPGFNKFVTQMEISPNLVSMEYSLQVFRGLTKDKINPEIAVIAVNSEEFKTALILLAVGSKAKLREMTAKSSESEEFTDDDFKDFLAYLMLTPDVKKTMKMLQGLMTLISKKGTSTPTNKAASEMGMKRKVKSTTRLVTAEAAE